MFGLDTKKPPMQSKGGLIKSLKTIFYLAAAYLLATSSQLTTFQKAEI